MIQKTTAGALCCLLSLTTAFAGNLTVEPVADHPVRNYAVKRLKKAFTEHPAYPDTQVRFTHDSAIPAESYQTDVDPEPAGLSVHIHASDARGELYGALNLLEQLSTDPAAVHPSGETARFPFRALKFNLPWASYRAGEAISLHKETCRDLAFWNAFLDMMVDNRFNALTLWSLHPFPLMIRNTTYPEACELSDAELADWQNFWHTLFAMAKERGIETYLVNWNVFVSPAFAKYHGVADYCENPSINYNGPGDKSEKVKDYMRTTVTQVIDTYPNLTGLGVSLGERMQNFTPLEREQWIQDTFVAGMKEASRPIRFIHRLPFSKGGEPSGAPGLTTEQLTRQGIESLDLPTTVLTEAKFNWSHAHSTPTLVKIHGGKMGDTYWNPPPTNYKIHWMVRNEDFFALRWAEPDFVRRHIQMNGPDYVGGYYLGSECYIPAKDYMTQPKLSTGYAFERQWLYYMIWGRLLYNPELDNEPFVQACRARYGDAGETLFNALKLGSRMPLRLASFYNATWDFTLYSEGFMANSAKSNPERLITVEELIKRNPMDPDYLSVKAYTRMATSGRPVPEGKISPLALADELIRDGRDALDMLKPLSGGALPNELMVEVADANAWAHLSIYFGEKLNASVALYRFREEHDAEQGKLAVQCLGNAANQWELLSAVTDQVYVEMPLAQIYPFKSNGSDPRVFHWKRLLPAVRAELQRVKDEVARN